MFERLKKAVKNWMQTTAADAGIAKEFKDVFELSGVPASESFTISAYSLASMFTRDSITLGT